MGGSVKQHPCMFLVSFQGGAYVLQLMDTYCGGWALMLIGLTECVAVAYVYGRLYSRHLLFDIINFKGTHDIITIILSYLVSIFIPVPTWGIVVIIDGLSIRVCTLQPLNQNNVMLHEYSSPHLVRTPLLPPNSGLNFIRKVSSGEREHPMDVTLLAAKHLYPFSRGVHSRECVL